MTVYGELGVRTLINAKGPATRLSGGIMRPEVAEAMADASQACVDIADLQAAANIARKAIFMLENPKAAKAEGEEGRRAAEQAWQKWYEAKCKTWS